jgi:hypothetical protein
MSADRKAAIAMGVLYIVGTVTFVHSPIARVSLPQGSSDDAPHG